MPSDAEQYRSQIDELLNLPQQSWLLGAGISRNAGIPLMYPLTDRVEEMLSGDQKNDFQAIRSDLEESAHVEHVLSHIGDLISLAGRTLTKEITIGESRRAIDALRALHSHIQAHIRVTMRWGYVPAQGETAAQIGTAEHPIVSIEDHVSFVKALFNVRRAGLERRPPVAFFTTNYDTLIEDALAMCRVRVTDGFCGGAMAYWEPDFCSADLGRPFDNDGGWQAKIFKLHGSIDWFVSNEDFVVRRREYAGYPPETSGRLLIYPQATKYQATQKDPFASLFAAFRNALNSNECSLLAICGYSFGDEHINEEIKRALEHRGNQLNVLAFVKQPDDPVLPGEQGLPPTIVEWLKSESTWKDRLVIAGSRAVYHGDLTPKCAVNADSQHSWWTFNGVTNLLRHGPEVIA